MDIAELMRSEIERPVRTRWQRDFTYYGITRDDGLAIGPRAARKGSKAEKHRAKRKIEKDCKAYTKSARHRENCARYRARHREKVLQAKREYYARNKEAIRAKRRTEDAREKHRQRAAIYRVEHKMQIASARSGKRDVNRAYDARYREFHKMLRWFVRERMCKRCLAVMQDFWKLQADHQQA